MIRFGHHHRRLLLDVVALGAGRDEAIDPFVDEAAVARRREDANGQARQPPDETPHRVGVLRPLWIPWSANGERRHAERSARDK